MASRILILIIYGLTLYSCSEPRHQQLINIDAMISKSPKDALSLLNSLNYDSLCRKDQHYYNFLTLKASDKAYIKHTSDSLFISIKNYYSSHKKEKIYPEILYYGGRVYSDLGDYPTALRYFQNAVDLLNPDTEQLRLRSQAFSQIGRLLNSIRLFDKAIPYLTEAIKLDSIIKDSVNLIYDIQLLGAINLHNKDYKTAESKFKLARNIARKISPEDIYQQDMYLSAIKCSLGETDSALILIRNTIKLGNHIYHNCALKSGIKDTAFVYAKKLIKSENPNYRKEGYRIILSPELKDYISVDSIPIYAYEYRELMESYFNSHESTEALLQNSFYNYQLHERERIKAEDSKLYLKKSLLVTLLILLILIIVVLYLKNRNKSNLLQLHNALKSLDILRKSLISENQGHKSKSNKYNYLKDSEILDAEDNRNNNSVRTNAQELRDQLKAELLNLQHNTTSSPNIPMEMLSSETYIKLKSYIKGEKVINESNTLWDELDIIVNNYFPNFQYRMQLLCGGNLKTADYHIALLIKCGITPTQMSFLMGRTKGTISYRREALSIKIFDQKLGVRTIDNIIKAL